MKKISLWATMLAMIMVCGLSVVSCSKDDEKNNSGKNGGNNGGKQEQTYEFNDYINAYYVRCERVGANLVIEMIFENITDYDINGAKLTLVNGAIVDNLGNLYYINNREVVLASATNTNSISNYTTSWQTLNIPANGYVVYYIKIYDFDSTNTARTLSFDLSFSSSSLPVESFDVTAYDFIISDNRIMDKGIMTNDTALVYTVTNCERVGSVLQIDYTITNTSKIELGNITFTTGSEALDDLGNYYYNNYVMVAFGEGTYKDSYIQQIKSGETINGRVRIQQFDATNKAKFISVPIGCTSSTYVFSDNTVRFLTIPIKDNRVLNGGIQTPDLKLDFSLTSAKVDDEGNLIVNYTIKNNTGDDLKNVELALNNYALDDLSNEYSSRSYSVNGSDFDSTWWGAIVINSIAQGASIPAAIKIMDFNEKAKNVSFGLSIKCDNYECADGIIRFLTIPIQK